ncbi:MAG: AI-2E family transporter [Candidatus Pacebacteria bacterium]|nr:AI-2E family transporter [Candidatus Paceibacterota bacterium]
MNGDKVLDISWGTILKISFAFLIFYIVYLIRDILIWFIFALIISVLFNPAIKFLQKLRIPRTLAVIFIYVAIFGILGLTIYWTAPMFVLEIQQFSQLFPQYFEKIAPPLRGLGIEAFESMETFTQAIGNMLQKASSDILSALALFFGGIGSTIFILAIALFLSFEEGWVEKVISLLSPKKYEAYVLSLWERSQNKVSGWFGSRILTCVFVGIAFFITLYLFNVKYALSLSLLAGVLNFIPVLGPVIVGAVAFLFVALDSWLKALFVLIAFFLIQQVEGNIIAPILTKKFVGLPPVMVLISLSVGAKLLGILGAVLAIPLTGILFEFIRDFLKRKKEYVPQDRTIVT